jgi:broad specificity phosphatase PhoE
MDIYLIRHGEKEDSRNHESVKLTEKGFRQAELTGMLLESHGIERIYSSNMLRAIQTSEAINRYINTEIEVVPELREIHMGICETEGWDSLEKKYPEYMKEFNRHESDMRYPPDGECGRDAWERQRASWRVL